MRKIHNIVTFSTKLQEVDIYFSFKVLRQYCQFLFVKYVELNSLQGKGWEREIHRGGPWGQPQHPQCEGRCTDLKICGVVNKLNIKYMRHDNVYLDTSTEIFVLCVLEGTSCILFVTTMDYIIQVYGNALQKYFSGFERSECVPEGTATQSPECAPLYFYISCVAY